MTGGAGHPHALRGSLGRLLILLVACLLVFRSELQAILHAIIRDPDAIHGVLFPVLAWLLLRLRAGELAAEGIRGTCWGLPPLLLGIGLLMLATWPFNYGSIRWLALVPVAVGCVLLVGGWRWLRTLSPILLLLVLSIPIGSRYYAFLMIKPETWTLEISRLLLDMVPGVFVDLEGTDLTFLRRGESGVIALAETRKGASLLLASAVLTVFLTCIRIRPAWQVLIMLCAAAPIACIANLLRLLSWGIVTIFIVPDPASGVSRVIATLVSLCVAAAMSMGLLFLLEKILIEEDGIEMEHVEEHTP